MTDNLCRQCNTELPEHRWWCQFSDQLPPPQHVVINVPNPLPELGANSIQVGGEHYKSAIQHWDWVASNDLDYFQGQITKYVARWKKKNGLQDLEKAKHFLEKYIELEKAK